MLLALVRMLALCALAVATAGAYLLDFRHDVTTGYALLLAGAAVIALLPEPSQAGSQTLTDWLAAILFLAAGIVLNARVATSVAAHPDLPGATQTALWLIGGLCLPLGFHFLDRLRGSLEPFLERADWLWLAGLSLAASAARVYRLDVGPPGLAPDELRPLGQTLKVLAGENLNAFWTDFQGFNGIFHYVSSFTVQWFGPLGLNVVQAAKLPGAALGGVSVGMLYLAVRAVAGRPVAATAGILLVWQPWHWSLSRFYYQYAADLGWISASIAFVLAGLRTGRFSLLAAGGFAAAAGASWLKTAVLAGPFAAALLVERLLAARDGRMQVVIAALVWGFSLTASIAPLAAQYARHPNAFWHYSEVSRKQAVEIERHGLSRERALTEGLRQAITVLQNRDAIHSRHAVRPDRPVLDLLLSALATVGFLWCVLHLHSSRSARIALLGFLFFLVPAAVSYPGDGVASISRRMQGDVFFIVWMAAEGAALVARRVFTPGYRFPFMVAIAASSMLLNLYAIRAIYGHSIYLWYDEMGGNKALILPALREAATAGGPVFFRPTYFSGGVLAAVADLPNVVAVSSVDELREKLTPLAGRRCTIVLTWDTATDRNDSPAWVDALADLIPVHCWQWGPSDPLGDPVYRVARVRLPDAP